MNFLATRVIHHCALSQLNFHKFSALLRAPERPKENPMMRAFVLGIAVLTVSAASASADGYGYRHHYGYYRAYHYRHYYDYGYFRVYAGLYGGGYRPWGWRGWW
jgi:hypothetical protein